MLAKLTSRKFWALLIAVLGSALAAFGVIPQTTEGILAVIAAVGACVAYIFGEGAVDAANAGQHFLEVADDDNN